MWNLRFAGLVTIVRIASFSWCDWGIINELQQVLSVASNDGNFLTMLTKSIKLVSKCCLELLTGNVGKLGLRDKRFGFSADEFLLEDDDAGAVGLLVLELRDLVRDLLLSVSAGLNGCFDVSDALDCYTVLVVAIN